MTLDPLPSAIQIRQSRASPSNRMHNNLDSPPVSGDPLTWGA